MVKKKKISAGDRTFHIAVLVIVLLMCVITLYPIYYMLIVSISDGNAVLRGDITILPKGINFGAYKAVLSNEYVPKAYLNTLIYTVAGTLVSVGMTALCAYPLSRKEFYGRGIFTGIVVFTMFFDAGIISNYMVVQSAGLMNSIWAIILPGAINVWYMIIMRTFFKQVPAEIEEAAMIDGCGHFRMLFRIVLPASKAVLATLGLFYAVTMWNQYQHPVMFIQDLNLYPLQLKIRQIIDGGGDFQAIAAVKHVNYTEATLSAAAVVFAIVPILIFYPWLQKYFAKGAMLGSVKG